MKHLTAANRKAVAIEQSSRAEGDVYAMQEVPVGCTTAFDPGWEIDFLGGLTSLCQPVERDLYACSNECWWPAQVPDQMTNYPDWSSKCAMAVKDWRNIDGIFP